MAEKYLEPFRIDTPIYADERGLFTPAEITKNIPDFKTVQVNTVCTENPYTFRGLHWQVPPFAQAKLIRCLIGNIIDFAIDIREGSPNYGKTFAFALSKPAQWVYIPEGFAHGYFTLPHNMMKTYPTMVEYLVNNEYSPEHERGLFMTKEIHDTINRELPIGTDLKMSDRDWKWPNCDEFKTDFYF